MTSDLSFSLNLKISFNKNFKMAAHVQVKFFTKQPKYSVPDVPFSVPVTVTVGDLSSLINSLLVESRGSGDAGKTINFDILVGKEFLRLSLDKHLELKDISTENVVEIEYVERYPAPTPEDSLQHDDWVSAVKACGDWIVTGCYDNTITIWSLDGERKLTIPGHLGPIKALSWLNASEGNPVLSFVSASHDQNVIVWEWNSLTNSVECLYVCKGHERSVDCVAVDETKTKIATGSWDKMLKIWLAEASDEEELVDQNEFRKKMKTEHGRTSKTKTPLITLSGHNEVVSGVSWMEKNEICTASWDHTLRIWDLGSGTLKDQFISNKNFLDIAYSPLSGLLLSGSADPYVRLWDPRSKGGNAVQSAFSSHTGWVTCVSWSPKSEYHFVSGAHDWILKQWDTRSPRAPLYDLTGHSNNILSCDWSNADYILSGSTDNKLKVYKAADYQ